MTYNVFSGTLNPTHLLTYLPMVGNVAYDCDYGYYGISSDRVFKMRLFTLRIS